MAGLPVFRFHTKTIQSILDPVAAQVSQLVILHEEAEEGKIIEDLTGPVAAVGAAVKNLVDVGKATVSGTKDEKLKEDMPPTFKTVEDATDKLIEASKGLAADAESKPHKKMLLDGARGILTGVSSLLLVFDQSEVRKIVKHCEQIMEYVKVSEVVQMMEELVTFTKNLSPGMTSMTKMVDTRTDDLVNPSHVDILSSESEQVKRALPLLLSAMKAFVSLKAAKKKGAAEAQENRNYIVLAMNESILEIIRVLQLTSPTEEAGAFASSTGADGVGPGGLLPGTLAAKIFTAKDLISQTGADMEVNKRGIQAVEEVLKEARRLAKGLPPEKREAIEKICTEIESLMKELAELQANGQGDSERAREIALALQKKMDELEREMRYAAAKRVVEDFKDPMGPLTALTTATMAAPDAPNREENYAKKASEFEHHSKRMADTAATLAKTGGVTDRKMANDLISTSGKVKALSQQVVHASKIAFENPENQEAKEHYELLKEDYQRQVEKLTKLVDGAVDPVDFMKASEEQLRADLESAKALSKAGTDPQAAFAHVASGARTAKRVVAIAKGEAENSEDIDFQNKLNTSSDTVTTALGPMVTTAKGAITQSGNAAAQEQFSAKADNLVSAVHDVFEVVDEQYNPPPPPPPPPRPPSPEPEPQPIAPPRPPTPVEEVPLQSENPIGFAAHQLDKDAKQWESKDNAMVEAARKMAKLMMQMAKYASGEGGELASKKDFINTARLIAKESDEVVKMAKKVAAACTDKRMKRAVLQVVDKLPTISTQLKIIAAVKATRQGGDDPESDREATEMLTDNAQNLMGAVSEVLYATEAATIRVPQAEREKLGLKWVKR